jgi:hypothetical protein
MVGGISSVGGDTERVMLGHPGTRGFYRIRGEER